MVLIHELTLAYLQSSIIKPVAITAEMQRALYVMEMKNDSIRI